MSGIEYVIEQLGDALEASHAVISEQTQRIAALEAERDDLLHRADHAPQPT